MPLTGAVGSADWGWKVTDSKSPSSFFYIHGSVYKKMSCRRSREDTSY